MIFEFLDTLDKTFGIEEAQAHCDIPCGIYDPIGAQIAALTVVRMDDLIADLQKNHPEKDTEFIFMLTRYSMVKEEHAEKVKHEIRVIWGDYFKQQQMDKHPEVNDLVHTIMMQASKARQTTDRQAATQLVDSVNQFAAIFWDTKGIKTKKAKAPYAPNLEMVYPEL